MCLMCVPLVNVACVKKKKKKQIRKCNFGCHQFFLICFHFHNRGMQCCTVLVPYDQEPDTRAAAEAASSFEGPVPPDLDLENLSKRGEKTCFLEKDKTIRICLFFPAA